MCSLSMTIRLYRNSTGTCTSKCCRIQNQICNNKQHATNTIANVSFVSSHNISTITSKTNSRRKRLLFHNSNSLVQGRDNIFGKQQQQQYLNHQQQLQSKRYILSSSIQKRVDTVVLRYTKLEEAMQNIANNNNNDTSTSTATTSTPSFSDNGKEMSKLLPVVNLHTELQQLIDDETSLNELLVDAKQSNDNELYKECIREIKKIIKRKYTIEQQLIDLIILPKDTSSNNNNNNDNNDTNENEYNTILEIRAGTGGTEASLFTSELLQCYIKSAKSLRWNVEELTSSATTELGGIREASISISGHPLTFYFPNTTSTIVSSSDTNNDDDDDENNFGKDNISKKDNNNNNSNSMTDPDHDIDDDDDDDDDDESIPLTLGPYGYFKYESGVHRVQRVPINDVKIQTSACSVAVLPLPKIDGKQAQQQQFLPLSELKIETMRSSGAGGQHVNTTASAVRITHIPTGITASIQDERSQHQNKDKALRLITARVRDKERMEQQQKLGETRKSLMGDGDRTERIRTYNYQQDRISDHRCKITRYGISSLLSGNATTGSTSSSTVDGGTSSNNNNGIVSTFLPYLKALHREELLQQLQDDEDDRISQQQQLQSGNRNKKDNKKMEKKN